MTTTLIELTYAVPIDLLPNWDYFDNPELTTQLLSQWIKLAIKLKDQKVETYITIPGYPDYTDPQYIDNFIHLAVTLWKRLPKNFTALRYINTLDQRVRFKLVFDINGNWKQPNDVQNLDPESYIKLYPRPTFT